STAPAPVVDPYRRHERTTVVAVDAHPRSDVAVLPHRRSAARRSVVVRAAQLADRAAGVKLPIVLQRDADVRVLRGFRRKARGRPVLPHVVVQLEALVEQVIPAIEEPDPGAPRLLICAAQVSEIIDLEPGRPPLIRRFEHEVLAADLVELELFGIAAEHRPIRVEGKTGVRTLV